MIGAQHFELDCLSVNYEDLGDETEREAFLGQIWEVEYGSWDWDGAPWFLEEELAARN